MMKNIKRGRMKAELKMDPRKLGISTFFMVGIKALGDARGNFSIMADIDNGRMIEQSRPMPPDGIKIWWGGAHVLHDGVHYFFGGENWKKEDNAVKLIEKGSIWHILPNLPYPRRPAAFPLNGRIHVVGGWSNDFRTTTTVQVLDIATSEWLFLNPLPYKVAMHGVVVHQGTAYLSGGVGPRGRSYAEYHSQVLKYNAEEDSWEEAGLLCKTRAQHAMISYNQYIYIIGGFARGKHSLDVEIYDPTTCEATELTSVTLPSQIRYNCWAQTGSQNQYLFFRGLSNKLYCFDMERERVITLEGECPHFDYMMMLH